MESCSCWQEEGALIPILCLSSSTLVLLHQAYALEAVDFAQDQPKAVTGTLVALLVTMIFLTLRGGRKTRQVPEASETEGTEKVSSRRKIVKY